MNENPIPHEDPDVLNRMIGAVNSIENPLFGTPVMSSHSISSGQAFIVNPGTLGKMQEKEPVPEPVVPIEKRVRDLMWTCLGVVCFFGSLALLLVIATVAQWTIDLYW